MTFSALQGSSFEQKLSPSSKNFSPFNEKDELEEKLKSSTLNKSS
jgi:hypothetical protein